MDSDMDKEGDSQTRRDYPHAYYHETYERPADLPSSSC